MLRGLIRHVLFLSRRFCHRPPSSETWTVLTIVEAVVIIDCTRGLRAVCLSDPGINIHSTILILEGTEAGDWSQFA
ncbi:unnamed protein product [Penicillium roqueforti FM164]|uniref:Uncharacterized protein n=1 Tax=Penicillium roqueforti (strain FM164) TaxID=1365484 RepID=W6QWS5_PENRF|nr:unnamed protein product [Penicillium roqueforti FM164]